VTSCSSVNSNWGLLSITNLTGKRIDNIKIGDTVLIYSLNSGEKYDYWFNGGIKGIMKADGIDIVMAAFGYEDKSNKRIISFFKDNTECHFISNYQYNIDIQEINNKYKMIVNPGYMVDTEETGISTIDFPAK